MGNEKVGEPVRLESNLRTTEYTEYTENEEGLEIEPFLIRVNGKLSLTFLASVYSEYSVVCHLQF